MIDAAADFFGKEDLWKRQSIRGLKSHAQNSLAAEAQEHPATTSAGRIGGQMSLEEKTSSALRIQLGRESSSIQQK